MVAKLVVLTVEKSAELKAVRRVGKLVVLTAEESAELKAADIGRGRRASALELQPITPNLKFATRDKAHGFRRYRQYLKTCFPLWFNRYVNFHVWNVFESNIKSIPL